MLPLLHTSSILSQRARQRAKRLSQEGSRHLEEGYPPSTPSSPSKVKPWRDTSRLRPLPGYSASGRGYPDVSLAAVKYAVFMGDRFYGVSGTSASAPVLAGMFSNIYAARMKVGRSSIGWANPALYTNRTTFARDITSGHSKCCAMCTESHYVAAVCTAPCE